MDCRDIFKDTYMCDRNMTIMEVCGTHTMNIAKFGIRSLLPNNINIISGPGCPVCVTSSADIFKAIQIARMSNMIVATFGDMLRVPSNNDALINYKNVKMLYNPMDALKLAKQNLDKEIVLLGIGFETTAPLIANVIRAAFNDGIKNFSVISMNKIVPPAIELILGSDDNNVDGFLLPGHVAAITGRTYFDFIASKGSCGVISGFDPSGIASSIRELVKMVSADKRSIYNNYDYVVSENGNPVAKSIMDEVFDVCDSDWRGLGIIKNSGLKIKDRYSCLDADKKFSIDVVNVKETTGCICGQILLGHKKPTDCPNYGVMCDPSNPIGPCMVSSEGTCAAYFKYPRS